MAQCVEICGSCRRVRDTDGSVFSSAKWGDFSTYVEHSQVPASALILTATYCPDCDESYRLLMAYGRAEGVMEQRVGVMI